MRTPRIYTPQPLAAGAGIALEQEAAHHLTRVLRFQSGAAITLFNGDGSDYAATLTAVGKRTVEVEIVSAAENSTESPLAIHLGIAISRGERMDFVMQKATELGVAAITPLLSERVEVRLSGERAVKKRQHWQGVIVAACEQSGRARLPQLHPLMPLHEWAGSVVAERRLVLHHRSARALDTSTGAASAALLIGPEGGLSELEIDAAERAGFSALRLGPRVLRTETAPLAAIALLQFAWGDMG